MSSRPLSVPSRHAQAVCASAPARAALFVQLWAGRLALAAAWGLALACVAWAGPSVQTPEVAPSPSLVSGEVPPSASGFQAEIHAVLSAQASALQRQASPAAGEASAVPGRPAGGASAMAGPLPWRVSFEIGDPDPRLRLAPCARIKAYVPPGVRFWGRTRVGLRCEEGPVRWNIFWPVTVKVWAPAVVAASTLRPGEPLTAADLKVAQVDVAARAGQAVFQPEMVIGRSLQRTVEPGQALRMEDLKARRWFAAGDTVTVNVVGEGFRVQAEGRAMVHGDEGQCARIRAENGRLLCAMPVGERMAEVRL